MTAQGDEGAPAPFTLAPHILVIDNYDSFTWNLVHGLAVAGARVRVERNDALSADAALASGADAILISPGPGRPEQAGISMEIVGACAAAGLPLLGICLGHQAIAAAYGGTIVAAPRVMHGKVSAIRHDGEGLFAGLPADFPAARYHSLVVAPDSLPDDIIVTASADDGTVQGLAHRTLPIEGLQFHPESIASPDGRAILARFVAAARAYRDRAEATG